ncbi:transmembrane protein 232 isoform X1 [Arapaima gigas]
MNSQKKVKLKADDTRILAGTSSGPVGITKEFIAKYNSARSCEERAKYANLAEKLLNRSKRRAGINSNGEGHHTDPPLAWTELLLLSLCCGDIHDGRNSYCYST